MKRKFERPTMHAGLEALRHSPGVCTCQKLRSVTRAATRLYDEHLRPAGLTISQYGILAALYYVPSLPLLKLAKRLETERTTLTRSVARLERDGLVVLRDGGIAEQGTLAELLCCDGVFADYYRTQFIDGVEKPETIPLSA